jgi:hypothetical protein
VRLYDQDSNDLASRDVGARSWDTCISRNEGLCETFYGYEERWTNFGAEELNTNQVTGTWDIRLQ